MNDSQTTIEKALEGIKNAKPVITPDDQYGASILLQNAILEAQKEINKNMVERLYDDSPLVSHKISIGQRVRLFIREVENRCSNAYDCLVKGVNPYDY